PDLEHLLAVPGQEARQASAVGAGALDRERTPTRRVLLRHSERVRVAATVSRHRRLEHDHAAAYIDDSDRVLVAVRVDTDHAVQLICNHPDRPPAQRWGTTPVAGLGMEPQATR